MEEKLKSVMVLGVRVDKVSMGEAVNLVEQWVKEGARRYIVTTNPEFVMAAQNDPEFRKVLNNSDLAVPDGMGLKLAGDMESIIPGVDLVEELCARAADYGFTTGFLGGRSGVAKKAAECLQKKYHGLKVVFAEDGPEVNNKGESISYIVYGEKDKNALSTKYDIPDTDLLFVAFGQVKQEKWMANNLEKIPVKVMMGVGGSFDEISGRVPRVPKWVQRLGLKWLVRLIFQPWRVKRQLALLKFVWLNFQKG